MFQILKELEEAEFHREFVRQMMLLLWFASWNSDAGRAIPLVKEWNRAEDTGSRWIGVLIFGVRS